MSGAVNGAVSQVSTRVGSLAVEEVGAGPPLLLWPSLFCNRSMWRHQRAALAGRYRLLLVDPPGHGDSGPPRAPYSLEDCATSALEVLDAYEVASAAWIGLSWGGMTALRAAIAAPERVRGLALFDTSADAEPWRQRWSDHVMAALYRRFGLTAFLARAVGRLLVGRTSRERHPEITDEVFDHVRGLEREGVLAAVDAIVGRASVVPALRRVTAPTLVAVGDEDLATPPRFAERIAAAIPGARLQRIAACGHLSALEAPQEVNRLLGPFLDGIHDSGLPADRAHPGDPAPGDASPGDPAAG